MLPRHLMKSKGAALSVVPLLISGWPAKGDFAYVLVLQNTDFVPLHSTLLSVYTTEIGVEKLFTWREATTRVASLDTVVFFDDLCYGCRAVVVDAKLLGGVWRALRR